MNNKEDSFSDFLKSESFFLLIKPEDNIYSNTSRRNSFSEDTAATIDVEVSELVDVAYKRATKVLSDNRTVLYEMAQMLIERETIDTEDIQDLLNRSEVKVANYI